MEKDPSQEGFLVSVVAEGGIDGVHNVVAAALGEITDCAGLEGGINAVIVQAAGEQENDE